MSQADTKNDAQLVLRVPQELADRLKRYAEKCSRDTGFHVTTASAARKLLDAALAKEGVSAKAKRGGR